MSDVGNARVERARAALKLPSSQVFARSRSRGSACARRRKLPSRTHILRVVRAEQFQLVGPYEPNPRRWLKTEWTDRSSGKRFRVSTQGHHRDRRTARVQTCGEVTPVHQSIDARRDAQTSWLSEVSSAATEARTLPDPDLLYVLTRGGRICRTRTHPRVLTHLVYQGGARLHRTSGSGASPYPIRIGLKLMILDSDETRAAVSEPGRSCCHPARGSGRTSCRTTRGRSECS